MGRYNKFIVSLVGTGLLGLQQFADITIPYTSEEIVGTGIALLTAFGVRQVPNT